MTAEISIHSPPLPDNLPPILRESLVALEGLGDDELRAVMYSTWTEAQSEEFVTLREKFKAGILSDTEQTNLDQLRQAADLLTLRKAYAAALLKGRGQQLPTLDELENRAVYTTQTLAGLTATIPSGA